MTNNKQPLNLDHAAILVIDMLNDFVTGALACERGKAIVPATAELLDAARKSGKPVIFCNDSHFPVVDHEFKLWGEHAIRGSKGADVIPELKACGSESNSAGNDCMSARYDFIIPKRRYSGFFHTDLDLLLKELRVDTVIMTGIHTHVCVRHTAADAYMLDYNVVVAKDATTAFTQQDHENGLADMKACYGADAYTNEELIAAF